MYYRRQTGSGCFSRLLAGALIVGGALIIFAAYQGTQLSPFPPTLPTPTRIANAVAVQPTEARGGLAATGTPPSQLWIESEKARLNAQITKLYFGANDTWNVAFLGQYAGHLEGTANIGQGGNFVLAGHVEMRDGTQGPFASLNNLQRGDFLTVSRNQPGNIQYMQYVVTEKKTVQPTDLNVIRNKGYEELTLITCGDYDFKDNLYKTRLVIHARPVKDVPGIAAGN